MRTPGILTSLSLRTPLSSTRVVFVSHFFLNRSSCSQDCSMKICPTLHVCSSKLLSRRFITLGPKDVCKNLLRTHATKGPSIPEGTVRIQDETNPDTGDDSISHAPAVVGRFQYEKLFSNVNESTLRHEPGSLSSAILLIAGTTVGAGILAIPAVTQEAGFLASSATCIICWLYMVGTGLLVAEVNINTMCELGSGGVSLVSMASRTLGLTGVRVASITYLFIHYALLVAYVARSSEIISNVCGPPLWISAAVFTGSLGGLCYFSSQRVLGVVNGVLVIGIVLSFAVLVGATAGGVEIDSLMRSNLAAASKSVPVITLAFVYQNVVPVVCTSLEGDILKIRKAVILGTAIPLVMFLVWDAVILGSIPSEAYNALSQAVPDPLMQLRSANGIVGPVVETFSLLAIATSYIGFVLGLSDFLSDLLQLPGGRRRLAIPYLLTLIPPLGMALISPNIFFNALDFAGTYGVLVLFGILPAAMAWSERYSVERSSFSIPPIVPGGRITLGVIMGCAAVIITSELLSNLSQ